MDGKSLKALKDLVDENPEIDEQPLRAQIIKEYRVSEGRKLSFDVKHHRLKQTFIVANCEVVFKEATRFSNYNLIIRNLRNIDIII